MGIKTKIKLIIIALYKLKLTTLNGPVDKGYNKGLQDAIDTIRQFFPDIKADKPD